MGKSFKAGSSNIPSKKTILKNKSKRNKKPDAVNVLRKKPDIIESYLRTLSNNFGTTVSNNTNFKRKHEEDDSENTPAFKKPKLVEDCESPTVHISNTATEIKFEHILTHLDLENELKDLFHMDEIKSSNEPTYYVDWLRELCDEISLEGLDGITIEALWSRMKSNSSHPVLLEERKDILWKMVRCIDEIEFYILEHPRGTLMIYDKNAYVCPESGIVLEPKIDYGEIYPYAMVNKDGVRGSCATYLTRMENSSIIRNLGIKEALDIYGNRLIAVASQKMRENAIISEIADPLTELVDTEYGLLERIGRARSFGELTQGKVSALNIIKDSRSLFHIRKNLERKKLIKNQFFVLRNEESGQNKTGKLLHLPCFYRLQKNKTLLLIEEVVELLRQKPGFSLDFGEFKKYFPRSTGLHKIMKIPEFNKYIKTDIFRPYRYLYPNAKMSEWKYKNKNKEKVLRIFQLIDPAINVTATWHNPENEENFDEEPVTDIGVRGQKCQDPEFLKEVFIAIFKAGKKGITLQDLEKKVDLNYYTIRIALRKLQTKNVIDTYRTEFRKQRHIYYFSRCFHSRAIPKPLKRTNKLPQNILQKILRNKKRPVNKGSGNIIQSMMTERCQGFPLHCSAFVVLKDSTDSEPMDIEFSITWKGWIFRQKSLELSDIRITPKFCKVVFVPGQKIWKFIQPSRLIAANTYKNKRIAAILLKALIYEGSVDLQNMLTGNADVNPQMQNISLDFEGVARRFSLNRSVYQDNKDFLLGPSPVTLSLEKTAENIEITITQSTPPDAYITEYKTYTSFDKNTTPLSLSRTNMILDEINRNMIICDIYRLQRIIMDLERHTLGKKAGHGKIDKNTLHRILVRLVNEGYIKIFKYFMMSAQKYKSQWIIAHPTMDVTHSLMRSTQNQMVVRFFLGMDKRHLNNTNSEKFPVKKERPSSSPFDSIEVTSSVQTLQEMAKATSAVTYKTNRLFGRILGYQPKFVRMQLFHELLYYLIYDYEPLDKMSHGDIEQLNQYYSQDELRDLPPIYRTKIDWKMFIPPLPLHKSFEAGWALLCDVILSIPLSLWVKIFHISLECTKLRTYLEHPVRQHYLIKDVPPEFRYVLMYKRKYLFNAVELVYRLCFIGLVQMGPQSTLVKDQIFLYLNKKVCLLDTSTSGPSYHQVTVKNYEKLFFNFTSRTEVENYWCQLWTISMNTPLGQRRIMEGQSVTIETSAFKSSLLDSLKTKTPAEAFAKDYGHIPGDRRGAAGLDSSMWFHIKRNWLWSSKAPKNNSSSSQKESNTVRGANIAGIKPVAIKYKELMSQSRRIYFKADQPRPKHIPYEYLPKQKSKPNVIHRNIKAKKVAPKLKKDEFDAKDKMILKKVGKVFRSKFGSDEDRILYICRAANYFLSKNIKAVKLSRFLIRDILHILCPESHDKTSGACARRLAKLERSEIAMKRLKEQAHELINIKELSAHFSPIIFNLNKSTTYSPYSMTQKCVAFVHAVWYIYNNFSQAEKILKGQTNNMDYFSPANIGTLLPLLVDNDCKKSVFSPPSNEEDIIRGVIKSVLMSALHCSKLENNISYQFYQICKKYSDQTIRAAVNASKGYQAISLNKKSRIAGNVRRIIPFQLSVTYNNMQKSNFSCLTMHTIYQHFREITGETTRFADSNSIQSILSYSRMLARNEIATVWPGVRVELNVPDAAHVLCPNIKDKSVRLNKLAAIYQNFLKQKLQENDNPFKKSNRINSKISTNISPPAKCSKRLVIAKANINRLLSNLPCLCNQTIVENLSAFLKCTEYDQINEFLEIFLEALITITFNLISIQPDGPKALERYIAKFYRSKSIDSTTRMLEARIFKVGYIVKEFLKNYQLMDCIHCFEGKLLQEKDAQSEVKLRAWLEKTKINCSPLPNTEETVPKRKLFNSFYKYKLNRNEDHHTVKIISKMEDIPKIEEIVQGMMEPLSTSMKRNIPHVSDIVYLLSQDRCSNEDDETLIEEMKDLFIVEYPKLKDVEVEDLEEFKKSCPYLFDESQKPNLEQFVYRYCHIKKSSNIEMVEKIKEKGGNSIDHLLAGEIIGYVFNKKYMGATGPQIKKTFQSKARTLKIEDMVEIICDCFVFLEVGITEKVFVHIEHSEPWLVETFHLSSQDNKLLHNSENEEFQELQEEIESRINSSSQMKVIMMPWLCLDGTLNSSLLNKWLTIVLSYCLEHPGSSLMNLCEKFYLMKPVELHLLLRILQKLKCVEIVSMSYNSEDTMDCFMPDWEMRPTTILDSFQDMVINVKPLAAIHLGYSVDKENVDFE